MSEGRGSIDESVKDIILHTPMVEVIRKIFPDCRPKSRGCFSSPFREDRNPSFSIFLGHKGIWIGHDYSTGESYDNISLYREAYPGLSYPDAVDELSQMLLGRSAYQDCCQGLVASPRPRCSVMGPVYEQLGALRFRSALPLSDPSVPRELVNYWRSRGLSDAVMQANCSYMEVVNMNRRGKALCDSVTGMVLSDPQGRSLVDDGVIRGYGMFNDIGGAVIRQADREGQKGFKGAVSSFITTVFADGSRPVPCASFDGEGDCFVRDVHYDGGSRIYINGTQYFSGVNPGISRPVAEFLNEWLGKQITMREARCICSVISNLCVPVNGTVAVVEGMTDFLSLVEFRYMRDGIARPGVDVVILNSVNNIKWAVPFLCGEGEVRTYLDNDLNSGAGQKASQVLQSRVAEFSSRCSVNVRLQSFSDCFSPCKDLNDYLQRYRSEVAQAQKKKTLQQGR